MYIEHSQKFPSVFGGHNTALNMGLRIEEGYCSPSEWEGMILPLRVGARTLDLLGLMIYICLGSW
jgi:hypothetical protein